MKDSLLPPIFLIVLSLAIAVFAMVRVTPQTDQVAVIFPPGTTITENYAIVLKAGGKIVRTGLGQSLLILENEAGISRRLRAQGALAVFNAAITGGCFFKSVSQGIAVQTTIPVAGAST